MTRRATTMPTKVPAMLFELELELLPALSSAPGPVGVGAGGSVWEPTLACTSLPAGAAVLRLGKVALAVPAGRRVHVLHRTRHVALIVSPCTGSSQSTFLYFAAHMSGSLAPLHRPVVVVTVVVVVDDVHVLHSTGHASRMVAPSTGSLHLAAV